MSISAALADQAEPLQPVFLAVAVVVMALAVIAPIAILSWAARWRARRALMAWAAAGGLTIENMTPCSAWGARRGPFNGTGGWMTVFHIVARDAKGESKSGYVSFGNFLLFGSFRPEVRW